MENYIYNLLKDGNPEIVVNGLTWRLSLIGNKEHIVRMAVITSALSISTLECIQQMVINPHLRSSISTYRDRKEDRLARCHVLLLHELNTVSQDPELEDALVDSFYPLQRRLLIVRDGADMDFILNIRQKWCDKTNLSMDHTFLLDPEDVVAEAVVHQSKSCKLTGRCCTCGIDQIDSRRVFLI